jgi:hypothetical protein
MMEMKRTRILAAIAVFLAVQVGCKVTQKSYPTARSTPIVANVPELLVRGEKYSFSIETTPGVECHAGIAYYNLSDKWTITELPTIASDKNGICEWGWEIPEDAKDGVGEFRGRIEDNEESHNTFPATFCIGQCP